MTTRKWLTIILLAIVVVVGLLLPTVSMAAVASDGEPTEVTLWPGQEYGPVEYNTAYGPLYYTYRNSAAGQLFSRRGEGGWFQCYTLRGSWNTRGECPGEVTWARHWWSGWMIFTLTFNATP